MTLKCFFWVIVTCFYFTSCSSKNDKMETKDEVFVTVLGIAQDAGYPQIACKKECCRDVWKDPSKRKRVSSIGIVDLVNNKKWIVDATPDFKEQCHALSQLGGFKSDVPNGILLTHAHMGHYTGLMDLGKEALGAKGVPVFAMPKMHQFLSTNGPWDQLVKTENIVLNKLAADSVIYLSDQVSIRPILVPHRDEYSETVGFIIKGNNKSVLFIPDIDKWQKWNRDIAKEISQVDYAFLDGTFYANGEIPGRDMSMIPHPFIEESMTLLSNLSPEEKAKIRFIHLNHTNPLLNPNSQEFLEFSKSGFGLAQEMQIYAL